MRPESRIGSVSGREGRLGSVLGREGRLGSGLGLLSSLEDILKISSAGKSRWRKLPPYKQYRHALSGGRFRRRSFTLYINRQGKFKDQTRLAV